MIKTYTHKRYKTYTQKMRQKENSQMIIDDTYVNEKDIPLRYYYQLVNEPEQAYQKQHDLIINKFIDSQEQAQLQYHLEKFIDKTLTKLLNGLKLP